jgi:outer membrane protein
MKKIIGVILLGIVITISGQQVGAQNVKYGYINRDELFKAMPDYDSATVQLEKTRTELQNQLAGMQNDLNIKTASLNNEGSSLSDFVRQNRQEELKNLNVRIQLFQVRANQQLEDKKDQLFQPVLLKADNAIKEVAKEQGFIFILDEAQLLYSDEKKCTNIMPQVKAKLGVK